MKLWVLSTVAMLGVLPVYGQFLGTCSTASSVVPLVRNNGKSELLGDILLSCTGGTPTPAGSAVPQVNVTITTAANLTSKVTTAPDLTEAVLLVDEPNSNYIPGRPLLNCGNTGAPDNGLGAGICSIVSNGVPSQTYDATPNAYGIAMCDGLAGRPTANSYSCGRPNAFQGRLALPNQVRFLAVPFDPAGANVRLLRITGIRIDATTVTPSGSPTPVQVFVSMNGSQVPMILNPTQVDGYVTSAIVTSVPGDGTVTITENFASALRAKNLAMTVGNGIAGNATFGGSTYTYNGNTNYPPDLAQNVPGTVYYTEDGFQWQNNGLNAPPVPNPPPGYGVFPVVNVGNPFFSVGYGGTNTGITSAGVANTGTRIALTFTHLPGHRSIQLPTVVYLFRAPASATPSGVAVLTATDSNGAGGFSRLPGATATTTDMAVYEILYADLFAIEFLRIPLTLMGPGSGAGVRVSVSLAPFVPAASIPSFVETTTTYRPF